MGIVLEEMLFEKDSEMCSNVAIGRLQNERI